ncbi:hypothetical protein QW71_13710 [Paenibacillus sp. IHB B 3415]|uniref:family 43 glycosylhydrolase n=1 Tax=Paenibacillus sp. IHB B 3415 TaxID=867080 RepID=UPI0005748906|nr:family 43 glycosylhydrolase [Paenibacillus sp. IHB B 3415]KHL95255.1 hypothetical protein QW71_13710 [Paenibacillus sp. IHB B 3415]
MVGKKVIAYTDTSQEWKLGQSMHLALYGSDRLISLNFGYGVLFAPAHYENTSDSKAGVTGGLVNPWIFRMSDGTIGVVAQSTESSSYNQVEVSVAASPGKLLFWTTTDLVSYESKGFLTITEDETISRPQVTRKADTYYISWEGDCGEVKVSSTTDFVSFSALYDSPVPRDEISVTIDNGDASCVFELTDLEKDYLTRKLGPLENTGVNPIPDLTVRVRAKPDFKHLPKLTALYNDSSTAEKRVEWDQAAFDSIPFHQPGTYMITGKVDIREYAWPMITQRADPHVVLYKNKYYFIATDDDLQERLYIRVSDTLEGIADAPDHLILNRNPSGDMSGLFWAPELHLIGNKLSILFAASTESSPENWWRNVQCRVMQLVGSDPLSASDWGQAQRVMQKESNVPLYNGTGITLDMTYFEVNGTHYYMWSQRDLAEGMDSANLMIAAMNPENPASIASVPICLAKPQFGWDRQGEVNEGPYMIRHHDDVYVTFSGSNTDNTYAVGLLSAKATADLLRPGSWKVTGYPVLASNHVSGQLGPGHNAFIKDENGNDVMVFHARLNGEERCTGMRTVHWAFDGSPILYMTPERELKPEFRAVTLCIRVVGESEDVTSRTEDLADYSSLLTYVKGAGEDDNHVFGERESAMYAAVRRTCESDYTLLNSGKPILYPVSSYAANPIGSGLMKSPHLFRKPDGTFGLIAGNNNAGSQIYLWDTDDLIAYRNERLLLLNTTGIDVKDPWAIFDDEIQAYRIRWTGGNGRFYETLTNLIEILSVTEIENRGRPFVRSPFPVVSGPFSELKLSKVEYERVVLKYSGIVHTAVEPQTVTVRFGEIAALPDKVKCWYSDGSSKHMGVEWDTTHIEFLTPGVHTFNGTVKQEVYAAPFIKYRADPYITKGKDGYYYFTASYPINGDEDSEGYDRIVLRRSKSLEGLGGTVNLDGSVREEVHEIVIWDEKKSNTNHRFVWAPEIHQIQDKWYVFLTSSRSQSDIWAIRPSVISCGGDGDPFKPGNWDMEAKYCEPMEEDMIAFSNFSLDMTYFESGGEHYVVWAQYVGHSCLLIAKIDPNRPWELTSKSVILSTPEYAWEKTTDGNTMIDEGPAVIKHDGTVYLAFSASSVNWSYCIGIMTASEGSNLLDPQNWIKNGYPVLATDDLAIQLGPGHNSFTVDELGNPVIVYHARTPGEKEGSGNGGLGDPGRHAHIKRVHFKADGDIVFNMMPEEELNPHLKKVTLNVVVKNDVR